MTHEDKFIEHLSRDIATQTSYLVTFRSRLAFTILIGPFVLLGSFLIAANGIVPASRLGVDAIVAIVIACVCYLVLGVYGAMLDNHVTRQCNTWRRQIDSLRKDSPEEIGDIGFEHKPFRAYLAGLGLVLLAFLSIAYLLKTLLVSNAG